MSSIPIPSDLINQIQSTLRSKSQIYPSSNPPLPSLNDLTAAFDSDCDPSHLCCSNCLRRSGLVRGDHSTLCIFCGRDRGKDGITHTVPFNSTLACKNMLQYLQLDGSEPVNFETKANDSDKGQETQQSHMILSSLLNLELKWPSEKEETFNENPIKDEVSVPAVHLSGDEVSVPAVNLSEADFDNVFTDSMNRTIGASTAPIGIDENSLPLKLYVNTENQEALRKDDTSLFNDSRTSNVAASSSNIKDNQGDFDSFADWDASFQSANSGTSHSGSKTDAQNAFSKSVDLFEGSTASLAIPETSIKELVNSPGKTNNTGNNEESTDEWDIFGNNVVKNNLLVDSVSDLKSTNLTNENDSWGEGEIWATTASNTKSKCDDIDDNWGEGEIWSTASKTKSQHDDIDDSNQSADDLGNFSSVTSSSLVQNDVGTNTADHLQSTSKTNDSDIWGNNELWVSLSNTKSQSDDNDGMGNKIGEIAPADDWGNFSSSGKTIENVLSNTGDDVHTTSKTNDKVSWDQDEIWVTLPTAKTKHDNNDEMDNHGEPIDDWGDFFHGDFMLQNDSSHEGDIKPATNISNDIKNASKTNENDSLGQDEILVAKSNAKSKNDDNEMVNHEETVDDWGNFSSSANMVQSDLWTNTVDAIKSTSETNEFDNMEYRITWNTALNSESKHDDSTGSHKEPVDDWGTFSPKNNMVQNDLWTNTADHSQGTSKTNENVSWGPDELWTILPISKGENDDNCDTDNLDESADDWGEFSFSTSMVQNEVSTNTADRSKTTMKTNENDSWGLDETWASLNTKSKHDDNNGNFGDVLDYWHDFAISNEESKEKISNKHAPSMLKSVDREDIAFGDFMHSDTKLGASDPNVMNDIQMNEDHNDTKNTINASTEARSFGNLSDMCSQTAKTASRTQSLNPQDIRFDSLLYTNSISRASSNPGPFNDMNGNDCATKSYDKDDSFDAWQDFTSSKETSATNTVNDFDSLIYTSSVSKENVSTGSKVVNDDLLDALVFNPSKEFKSTNNLNDNNGLFEPWKDFTSLNEVPAQAKSDFKSEERLSGIKSDNSDDMEFGDFLQSSSTEITQQKYDNHDDNFDDWQDFVSSNNAAENSANMLSQPGNVFMLHEHVSNTKSMDL